MQTFHTVWFLPAENTWKNFQPLAYRDVGELTIHENLIEFRGKGGILLMENIRKVSYGKQGRDFINNWVRIEYGENSTAFIADGGLRGWSGIFGGTRKIFNSVRKLL